MTKLSSSSSFSEMATYMFLVFILVIAGYSDAAWCVCKPDASSANLQKSIDYACGAGADCNPIHPNGPCYNPNTVVAHCSYAANSYYQRNGQKQQACDFSGTAQLSSSDPSQPGCSYPATPSAAGSSSTTPSTTPTTPSTPTMTPATPGTPTVTPATPSTPMVTPATPVTPTVTPAAPGTPTLTPATPVTPTVTPAAPGAPTVTPATPVTPTVTPATPVTPTVMPAAPGTPTVMPATPGTPTMTPTTPSTPTTTPTDPGSSGPTTVGGGGATFNPNTPTTTGGSSTFGMGPSPVGFDGSHAAIHFHFNPAISFLLLPTLAMLYF